MRTYFSILEKWDKIMASEVMMAELFFLVLCFVRSITILIIYIYTPIFIHLFCCLIFMASSCKETEKTALVCIEDGLMYVVL